MVGNEKERNTFGERAREKKNSHQPVSNLAGNCKMLGPKLVKKIGWQSCSLSHKHTRPVERMIEIHRYCLYGRMKDAFVLAQNATTAIPPPFVCNISGVQKAFMVEQLSWFDFRDVLLVVKSQVQIALKSLWIKLQKWGKTKLICWKIWS